MTGQQIAALQQENQRLRAENTVLRAQNADLQALGQVLKARLIDLEKRAKKPPKNSTNSHFPPSSDRLKSSRKKKKRKSSGRKPGGQPGRAFKARVALPATETETVRPVNCQHCLGNLNSGEKVGEVILQRIDIPQINVTVTDIICETVVCPDCTRKTTGQANHSGRGSFVGPRLAAIMSTLSGRYHLSKRQVQEALSSILGVDIGLGSVTNVEQRISQAIAPAYNAAVEAVQNSPVVHADETSWPEGSYLAWLWTAATAALAVFQIYHSRGADAARRLLGEDFTGILISDRWGGYNWVDSEKRQFCWAHLLRDFQGWEDSEGRGASYGTRLHELGQETIHLWNTLRMSDVELPSVTAQISTNQASVHDFLKRAQYNGSPEIKRTAKRLLSQEECLWVYLLEPGVATTNNHAERVLRQAVLWRKKSNGTASGMGSLFVSRILTAVTSLRLQGRNVLDFLTASIKALEGFGDAPSLLPEELSLASS
jgi:transposase